MRFLSRAFGALPETAALMRDIRAGRVPAVATGLSHIHKAILIQTLCHEFGRRALVVVSDDGEAVALAADLQALGMRPCVLPTRDLTLREMAGASREYEHARVGALAKLASGVCDVALCSVEAARLRTMPPEVLAEAMLSLKEGDTLPPQTLCDRLLRAGYVRCDAVEGVGQFARRGDLVDVYPPDSDSPVRIEYWGDDIDSVHRFDPQSQRRTDRLDSLRLTPAGEVLFDSAELAEKIRDLCGRLPTDSPVKASLQETADRLDNGGNVGATDRFLPLCYREATVFDYAEGFFTFVSESARVGEHSRALDVRVREETTALFEQGVLAKGLDSFYLEDAAFLLKLQQSGALLMDTFARGHYAIDMRSQVNFTLRQLSIWNGSYALLKEDAVPLIERGFAVMVLAGTPRAALTLVEDLQKDGFAASLLADGDAELPKKAFTVAEGSLSAGLELPAAKVALITHGKVAVRHKRKSAKAKDAFTSLDQLHTGDYVVHVAHGIGVFEGVRSMTVEGVTKDYLRIHYAKEDVLYVPVTQLDLLSRYIGAGDPDHVRLHRLGGTEWQKARSRVKAAVRDMAKELIALYSRRMARPGFAFSPDCDFQSDFERRFEYEETEDQLRCIREIKDDMEKPSPMDRLLCGDVGFGKTEVALRAAFKCICDGKQCAILVPTTILAWQHYQTATRRMEGLPVTVEVLSRFRTPRQQKEILRKLKSGEIDLIIGTHKLLGEAVQFRDLGLLLVDEEQRFGVAQKEKLRAMAPNVDTLTLSATPIPRTLNMAMSGLRDMSTLDEAPADRSPVQTYVVEYDTGLILDAMRRELRRGGQVYYLHNKVESIDRCAARLQALLPEARFAVAHGKMEEEELSEVWQNLLGGEIDVLVCTTLIETGVDVPNVNTLIIEDADHMGLAQLHQIRGRVGRSTRRAYAYLTFTPGKVLTEIAQKRLEAIREFTEFGSGFQIAMRDLEIRGAGNLLGGEQHGHMDAVGYDMYIKLLNDAIAEEKGEPTEPDIPCTVDLPIGAHIPEAYIGSLSARLGIYRRIADIRSPDDASDVTDELIDRFGEPPASVQGLIQVALLRNRCAALGFHTVEQSGVWLRLYPSTVNPAHVAALAAALGKLFRVSAGTKPMYEVRTVGSLTPLEVLSGVLDAVERDAEKDWTNTKK